MTGWLAPSPPTGLVLDGMQVVSVKVAVALCADAAAAPGDLGPMTEHRVPLGRGMDALCERLRLLGIPTSSGPRSARPLSSGPTTHGLRLVARDGMRVDGPSLANRAGGGAAGGGAARAAARRGRRRGRGGGAAGGGIHTDRSGRVVVRLSEPERGLLRVACERLRGLLDGHLLSLADERAAAVRRGIDDVLADLRQPAGEDAPGRRGP